MLLLSSVQAENNFTLGVVQPCNPELWDMKSPETSLFMEKLQERTDLLYQFMDPDYTKTFAWQFIIDRQGHLVRSQINTSYSQPTRFEELLSKYKNDLKLPALPLSFKDPAACFLRFRETKNTNVASVLPKPSIQKFGFMKLSEPEKFFIPPQFTKVRAFKDGFAAVATGEANQLQWSFINELGTKVSNNYDGVEDFTDGVAIVWNGQSPHLLKGLIDSTGREIIAPQYHDIQRLSGGYFQLVKPKVHDPNSFSQGLADSTGKVIIPLEYDAIWGISEKTALVEKGDKKGYFDLENARILFEPRYISRAQPFSDGVAVVVDGDEQSFVIDKTGHSIIPPRKIFISPFTEGLASFEEKTEEIVEPLPSSERKSWVFGMKPDEFKIEPVRRNYYHPSQNKSGYIDKTGKIVVSPRFDSAESFTNGLAIVGNRMAGENDIRYGLIDKTGQFLLQPLYTFIEPFEGGFATVHLLDKALGNRQLGLINPSGKVIVSPQYSYIGHFIDGLALVSKSTFDSKGQKLMDQYGYINKSGSLVIPLLYKAASNFKDGKANAQLSLPSDLAPTGWVEIDTTGKVLGKAKFKEFLDLLENAPPLLPATEDGRQTILNLYKHNLFRAQKNTIENKVLKNWHIHVQAPKHPTQISYHLIMNNDGKLQKTILMSSSGDENMDKSALNAINLSLPFEAFSKANIKSDFNIVLQFSITNSVSPIKNVDAIWTYGELGVTKAQQIDQLQKNLMQLIPPRS